MHRERGLGNVIGIVVLLIILLVTLSLILGYLREFQKIGGELAQSQINIYNHENENDTLTAIAIYTNVSHQDCGIGIGAYHGKAYGITVYNLSYIEVTISNLGNIPSTINYIMFLSPANYSELFIYYVGQTIPPKNFITLYIYPNQLYAPYWPNWKEAAISTYVPYKIIIDNCKNFYKTFYEEVPVIAITQYGNAFNTLLQFEFLNTTTV